MIYIVKFVTATENRIVGREELDDKRVELEYLFDKETRRKIASIRVAARNRIYQKALDFYGLRLIKPEHMDEISKIADEADRKLREVHETLYARVIFIPIDESAARKGELYQEIIDAIRYHVYQVAFEKLKDVNLQHLHKRTKAALLRMCDRLQAINVLNDPDIDSKIQEIKEKIMSEDIEELSKEIKAELDVLKSRFAHLEI